MPCKLSRLKTQRGSPPVQDTMIQKWCKSFTVTSQLPKYVSNCRDFILLDFPHFWIFVFLVFYWLHMIHFIFHDFSSLNDLLVIFNGPYHDTKMLLGNAFVCNTRLVWVVSKTTQVFSSQSWGVPILCCNYFYHDLWTWFYYSTTFKWLQLKRMK